MREGDLQKLAKNPEDAGLTSDGCVISIRLRCPFCVLTRLPPTEAAELRKAFNEDILDIEKSFWACVEKAPEPISITNPQGDKLTDNALVIVTSEEKGKRMPQDSGWRLVLTRSDWCRCRQSNSRYAGSRNVFYIRNAQSRLFLSGTRILRLSP